MSCVPITLFTKHVAGVRLPLRKPTFLVLEAAGVGSSLTLGSLMALSSCNRRGESEQRDEGPARGGWVTPAAPWPILAWALHLNTGLDNTVCSEQGG